jgi:hypothetical protein
MMTTINPNTSSSQAVNGKPINRSLLLPLVGQPRTSLPPQTPTTASINTKPTAVSLSPFSNEPLLLNTLPFGTDRKLRLRLAELAQEHYRFNLRQLSDHTGISYQTLLYWNQGRSTPPLPRFIELLKWFKATPIEQFIQWL